MLPDESSQMSPDDSFIPVSFSATFYLTNGKYTAKAEYSWGKTTPPTNEDVAEAVAAVLAKMPEEDGFRLMTSDEHWRNKAHEKYGNLLNVIDEDDFEDDYDDA